LPLIVGNLNTTAHQCKYTQEIQMYSSILHSPQDSALDMIGNTPMVRIKNIDTGLCDLFLKLENQNPAGSIKDRIALSMINDAESKGLIKQGDRLIEATAGNTGLGLALVASQKGYKLTLIIPDKMSAEKVAHVKALGAEVIMTRSDVMKGHPEYYQDMAQRIARETGAFYINQFENPANPMAHEKTTAPEIWQQMDGDIDAIVCGVGSGGTLTGLGRYFARVSPKTQMVLADPVGSILAPLVNTGEMIEAGSWLVEGIGEDFIPDNCTMDFIKSAYSISDTQSFQTAHELLNKEGVLCGSSSGTLINAALQYCRAQTTPKRVVTFVCDSGNKYLSKMYNPVWLQENLPNFSL
jgi:cystathionine beta-synthase